MVDAVVLAGAPNTGRLHEVSPEPYEALIEIGGRPMLAYVLEALQASAQVGRLVVVGPPALDVVVTVTGAERVDPGPDVLANLLAGVDALGARGSSRHILVSTADIPLLTPEAVDDFLNRCWAMGDLDVYYPVVLRERSEEVFPGVERTYVRLKDGSVTGGNLFLVRADALQRSQGLLTEMISLRKHPLRMSRLLGPRVLVKAAVRTLSADDVARRIEKLLGLRGRAVFTPYPEIGVDVDKPSDLALVREVLEARALSPGRS
ncbi:MULTISPECIES: nucleotidyltransferase family protein [Limnochorda]|uniref:nucleotidyltransferase family protein n=1 Tax=Limnochorda TaxID=1676651 RepID=UPI001D7DB2A1|nr:nucleotidyltransferase family protein [Limnochorda pilosa]MBO2486075.1 hypothetical protein [Bacillota bacterium]MBO2519055.1 hypothetical protein [Bacillota bacterium]